MTPEERTIEIAKRKVATNGTYRLWVKGEWEDFPVYRVPVSALLLNVDNKRFAAERTLVEEKIGRPLDPENVEADEESIISILCDNSLEVDLVANKAYGKPSKDFEALRDDWLARKQAEPLWIRPDGTVHNGNRRLAMVKRLRAAGTAADWIDAIILDPQQIDNTELFRMEQREQLAENFKKRYADINALLALKEAAEQEGVNWSDASSLEAVATMLKHYAGRDDKGYALVQLGAVRAIEAYLDFIGAPKQYHLVRRQVEVFREVGQCMALIEDFPDEATDLVATAFAFVQSGRTYQDLRQLRALFLGDRGRFEALYSAISEVEEDAGWDPAEAEAGGHDAPDLDVMTGPDDEDDGTPDPETVSPSGYPKAPVKGVIEAALDEFGASSLDITTQLIQSVSRLDSIDEPKLQAALNGDNSDRTRQLVERIVTWSDKMRTLL
jgi:hypothetical protein